MTKICHLTSAHTWDDIRIFHKECRSLAQHHEVYLLAFNTKDQVIDNVHIVNAGMRPSGRLKRMLFSAQIILKKAQAINADVYHFHDPELIRVGKKLAKSGKKVIYDIHEDVPRQILSKPYLNTFFARIISFFYEKYENHNIKFFEALVCATPHIEQRFIKRHQKTYTINNYPMLSELVEDAEITQQKENKVCYLGSISATRGIHQLVEALGYCPNVELDLAGHFNDKVFKEKVTQLKSWTQVNELGFIGRSEVMAVQNKSKAGMVVLLPTPSYIYSLPIKLFEYMSAGLPVICSNFPLWKDIVEVNNCGLCVNPEDPKAIAEAMKYIIYNEEEAQKMGKNGKILVKEKYNWGHEEKKLIALYFEL